MKTQKRNLLLGETERDHLEPECWANECPQRNHRSSHILPSWHYFKSGWEVGKLCAHATIGATDNEKVHCQQHPHPHQRMQTGNPGGHAEGSSQYVPVLVSSKGG